MADIKNIDVFQSVTSVSFEVEPNTNIININKVTTSGYSGVPNLQEVTDIGATTTNGITITVGDGGGDGISSTSSQGYGVYGSSSESYGVYGTSPTVGVYGTSDNGYGVQGYSESGIAVYGSSQNNIGVQGNSVLGTAMYATSDIGTGLYSYSESGVGVSATSNSIGLEVNGNGTIAIEANLGNSNKGLVINSGTSSTGNFIELDKNGVDKLVVNQAGELTATKLIKQGGTSAQLLAANGDSITAGANITISGGTISSTGGGGGGATNLSPSQTATNFTINSDTGTDATIPLGNGTLAGATLNDYTTAEKNKLAGIATGAEVNVNADWNATSGDAQILNKPTIPSITNLVPYTGATTDVDLGLNDITAAKLIKDGGFDYQFLKADGSVDNNIYLTSADLPSTLDLYATTTASDISGYTVLVRNIADTRYNTTAQDVSTGVITSVGQLVGSLITDANIISGNPGIFDFKTIGNISRTNGTGQAEFFFRIYKRNLAGTETLIAQSDYTLPVTNGGYVEFSATALWNDGIFLDTDRVVLKYYANRLTSPVGSDPTYQFQFGGTSPVRSSAAIPTSVMPNIYLRDLADVENVDALNNEILYWNDPASLWEHSLAEDLVPLATATQKGLVSTTTQTFAGDKTFTGTIGASNLSNTNTGDNATNTQYSGLATSKQDTLQSTVNIKSINGNSILGSGDLTISGTGISSLNGLTGATQTFSVFTNFTGSPAFSSIGTNHQLRLPNAGTSTDYGLITNTSQSIGGTKIFVSNPEIPVPAGNSGPCIVLGSTGGGGATGTLSIGDTVTYPNGQEMQRVKGVTSPIQTQLDGKQPTLTAGNGIDITSNTISTVDTSKAAYTMLANNTNASAVPTTQVYKDIAEQTYSGTITWSTTAPTTILSNTYKWSQVGSLVTVRLSLSYSVAGSNTQVIISLPTDLPTPSAPTGFTGASDILYYGTGSLTTTTSLIAATSRVVLLRRNAANNGYEFVITIGAAVSIRVAHLTLQYFT